MRLTTADVGLLSPGRLDPVLAACCVTCARVDLFPWVGEGGATKERPCRNTGSRSARRLAIGAGWRPRHGDAVQPWVWQCPDCQPPRFGR